MKKNWKTSLSGIMAIVFGGWAVAQPIIGGQTPDGNALAQALTAIMAGIGLIAAKDHNVTGGTMKQ